MQKKNTSPYVIIDAVSLPKIWRRYENQVPNSCLHFCSIQPNQTEIQPDQSIINTLLKAQQPGDIWESILILIPIQLRRQDSYKHVHLKIR